MVLYHSMKRSRNIAYVVALPFVTYIVRANQGMHLKNVPQWMTQQNLSKKNFTENHPMDTGRPSGWELLLSTKWEERFIGRH